MASVQEHKTLEEIESTFTSIFEGRMMERRMRPRDAPYSEKKLCFVATDKPFLIRLLYELSLRPEVDYVKYTTAPCDGMYLGRVFLIADDFAGRMGAEYKHHPKLMVSIQDDDFFNAFRAQAKHWP